GSFAQYLAWRISAIVTKCPRFRVSTRTGALFGQAPSRDQCVDRLSARMLSAHHVTWCRRELRRLVRQAQGRAIGSARDHDVWTATRRIKRRPISAIHSTGHVLELREVERLLPFETTFGEHLKHRIDTHRVIQAADRDEDHSWEALQVAAEHPGAALWAEVSVQALARLGNVVKCLRLATDHRKVILRHAKERGRFTAGRLLAVKAVTDGDEGGIGVELEFDCAACALSRVLLCHMISSFFNQGSASGGSRRRAIKTSS